MASRWGKAIQQLRSERKVYQQKIDKLTDVINALKGLSGSGNEFPGGYKRKGAARKAPLGKRRRFSAATRARMAAAQKRRWAKARQGQP